MPSIDTELGLALTQDLPRPTHTMLLVSLYQPSNGLRTTANKDSLDAPLTRPAKPDSQPDAAGEEQVIMIEDRSEMISLKLQSLSKALAKEPPVITPSQPSRYHSPGQEVYAFLPYQIAGTKKPVNPED